MVAPEKYYINKIKNFLKYITNLNNSLSMEFWYIVFRTEDGRDLFGYFTKGHLKHTDLLLGTTVTHIESKVLPKGVTQNIAYKTPISKNGRTT